MTLAAQPQSESARPLPGGNDRTGSAIEPDVELRYIARQPIFDTQRKLLGYELLYRNGPENRFSGEGDRATRIVLDNMLLYGVGALAERALAFVNCTHEPIVEQQVALVNPRQTVLEVLETVEPDVDLLRSLLELKSAGYRIALDDFAFTQRSKPLLRLADYVKADFLVTTPEERRRIIDAVRATARNRNVMLIAEKIETEDNFAAAVEEGSSTARASSSASLWS